MCLISFDDVQSEPLPNPTDFQQNPFKVLDLDASQEDREKERDEAAADMFLNWIYSKIGQGGFQNIRWEWLENGGCHLPAGSVPPDCLDDSEPGVHRLNWMNTTMTDLLASLN